MAQLPSALAIQVSSRSRTSSPAACTAKSMIVVVPPQAAARVPVSKSSEATVPPKGSSMWVWPSTPPGTTSLPVASRTSSAPRSAASAGSEPGASRATMVSPSTSTSMGWAPVAETTVPPLISSDISGLRPCRWDPADRNPPGRRLQATREAVPPPEQPCRHVHDV